MVCTENTDADLHAVHTSLPYLHGTNMPQQPRSHNEQHKCASNRIALAAIWQATPWSAAMFGKSHCSA